MPLIELEPPKVRPRGQGMRRPAMPSSASISKFQLKDLWLSSRVKPAGMSIHIDLSRGPASSSSTLTFGSSVSRLASTQPAEPPPTMT